MRNGLWVLLMLLACNKENPGSPSASSVHVTVSGMLNVLPFDTHGDFSQLKVAVVDPAAIVLDPNAAPLATATVNATACDANSCPFSVPDVPLSKGGLGLALQIMDQRSSALWPPIYTGIALGSTVDAAYDKRTDIAGCTAVVITNPALQQLVTASQQPVAQLLQRGMLLGIVLGRASEVVAMSALSIPPPQAGVTVALANDPNVGVWYPSADLASDGNSTASTGLFFASPTDTARLVLTNPVITPAANDPNHHTWTGVDGNSIGSTPGHLLFLEFEADN